MVMEHLPLSLCLLPVFHTGGGEMMMMMMVVNRRLQKTNLYMTTLDTNYTYTSRTNCQEEKGITASPSKAKKFSLNPHPPVSLFTETNGPRPTSNPILKNRFRGPQNPRNPKEQKGFPLLINPHLPSHNNHINRMDPPDKIPAT